jgi:hypothetical protein
LARAYELLGDEDDATRRLYDIVCTARLALHYLGTYAAQCSDDRRFRNFIARLLVAKYPHQEAAFARAHQERVHCRALQAVVRYVQNEAASPLVRRNYHWRDLHITFREEGHRYTLLLWDSECSQYLTVLSHVDDCDDEGGEHRLSPSYDERRLGITRRDLRSMTTFIKSLHDEFEPDRVIAAMMANEKKWNDPKLNPKYYGMSPDAIKALWEQTGAEASAAGTAMHLNLENRALGRTHERQSKEYRLYERFEREHVVGKLRPYRAEWMVWDAELMLCGSIDIVYEYEDPGKRALDARGKRHLVIGDYKRSKEIKLYNEYQSMNEKTLAQYAGDCNYVHYTIQLCGYKYILEKNYDVVVDEMFLIVLHPDQRNYIKVAIAPEGLYRTQCEAMMRSIFQYRARALRGVDAGQVNSLNSP